VAESVRYGSGSTFTVWQFVVFLILLYSHPDDYDGKRDQNLLVINNVW